MVVIRSVSVNLCGTGHKQAKMPCQDKYAALYRNNVYVAALADGAGSKIHSDIGAQIVVETVCNHLCDNFGSTRAEILNDVLSKLDKESENIKDFASTLMFVAVKGDNYLAGHIGDGVIGICRENFKTLSEPQNGTYKNETMFITDKDAINHFRIYTGNIEDVKGFVLMTDGLSDTLYNYQTKEISRSIFDIAKLLESDSSEAQEIFTETVTKFALPRTNDDVSGIILWL